jgi:cell division control protein 7
MELDPSKRFSAEEALQHEFFTNPIHHDVEWGGHPEESAESGEDEDGGDDEADEVAML